MRCIAGLPDAGSKRGSVAILLQASGDNRWRIATGAIQTDMPKSPDR
jgi:hypothetical protein